MDSPTPRSVWVVQIRVDEHKVGNYGGSDVLWSLREQGPVGVDV